MMEIEKKRSELIEAIFRSQDKNGLWKLLPQIDPKADQYLHYVPNFKASLWALIQLADLKIDPNDRRVLNAISAVREQFYDSKSGIYCLGKDHFPIPCLNGNMIYIDAYYNRKLSKESIKAIEFFHRYQRFDDGEYVGKQNEYCENKSCYGKHSCYWGIIKLLKGLSFVPKEQRSIKDTELLKKCIDFTLLHRVCYSSKNPDKAMVNKIDYLTFPNMYKSDILEILWLLSREGVKSDKLTKAIDLLVSKRIDGKWKLERKINNLNVSIGAVDTMNVFVTERAQEVLKFYKY